MYDNPIMAKAKNSCFLRGALLLISSLCSAGTSLASLGTLQADAVEGRPPAAWVKQSLTNPQIFTDQVKSTQAKLLGHVEQKMAQCTSSLKEALEASAKNTGVLPTVVLDVKIAALQNQQQQLTQQKDFYKSFEHLLKLWQLFPKTVPMRFERRNTYPSQELADLIQKDVPAYRLILKTSLRLSEYDAQPLGDLNIQDLAALEDEQSYTGAWNSPDVYLGDLGGHSWAYQYQGGQKEWLAQFKTFVQMHFENESPKEVFFDLNQFWKQWYKHRDNLEFEHLLLKGQGDPVQKGKTFDELLQLEWTPAQISAVEAYKQTLSHLKEELNFMENVFWAFHKRFHYKKD